MCTAPPTALPCCFAPLRPPFGVVCCFGVCFCCVGVVLGCRSSSPWCALPLRPLSLAVSLIFDLRLGLCVVVGFVFVVLVLFWGAVAPPRGAHCPSDRSPLLSRSFSTSVWGCVLLWGLFLWCWCCFGVP